MSQVELEQFYEASVVKIYRYFFYKVFNREISEDLTSQCFLKFAKENQRNELENPKAFLYGIAKFVLLDYLRDKYKRQEVPLNEEDESFAVEYEVPLIHILDHLERMLPELPEKQAEVLRLRFLEKLTLSEIAEKLGKDVNHVSTTQKRAFQTIKALLECTEVPTNIAEEQ